MLRVGLSKNYQLLNFLNRDHSRVFLWAFSFLTWLFILFLCVPPKIAKVSARQVLEGGGPSLAVRRMVWFLRASWFPVKIIGDDFFDITQDFSKDELLQIISYIKKQKRLTPFEKHIWLADIYGGILESECKDILVIENGLKEYDNKFIENINRALGELKLDADYRSVRPVFPPTSMYKQKFIKSDAEQALHDLVQMFGKLRQRFFVISGTFLGAVREKDFLEHDYDLDVGVDYDEYDFQGIKDFLSEADTPFSLKTSSYCVFRDTTERGAVTYSRMDKPILIRIVHSTGVVVDIFVHVREGDCYWHGSPIHRWDNHYFELSEWFIGGQAVLGPDNFDLYLTENYGDWRTPVVKFNSSMDTPNISYSSTVRSISYFLKIIYRFLAHGDRGAANHYIKALIEKGVLSVSADGRFNYV